MARSGFKWILTLEALLSGAYVSLTRGLFIIYLVSVGYKIEGISLVVLVSAAASTLASLLLFKHPSFIVSRVKLKLTGFHALERVMWLLTPLTRDSLSISILYSTYMIFSSFISTFLSSSIYGSLTEDDVKDVTAKRSVANGVSSILGYSAGVFLLAFLPADSKFIYIFSLGSLIGLMSTFLVIFLDLSHLEGAAIPQVIEQPEKIFSTSTFFVILLASSNFLGVVWSPYLMNHLHGPDFLAAFMSLVGTMSSIIASLAWRRRALKTLRIGLALNALGPPLIWATPWPTFHGLINAYSSFTFTGANFLGAFLFAKYNEWFGAVKSGILLVLLSSIAQLIAALLGILTSENYLVAFLMIFAIKATSCILAILTISEVSVVPEDQARTYSRILYTHSLLGYSIAIEVSRETILTTLRLLALSVVIATLYLIFRILSIMIG